MLASIRNPERLEAVRRTNLLDSLPEASFDRLTRLASRLLDAPVALVCLLDEERQFLKSAVGLGEPWASRREMPMAYSYCQHAVDPDRPLVIEDARDHPLVHDSPATTENGTRAYVGVPLTSGAHVLGTLCVVDSRPRQWTAEDIQTMRDLAAAAQTEIDLRGSEREALQNQNNLRTIVDAQQAIAAAGLDLHAVMAEAGERARGLTRAAASVVELSDGEELVSCAASGTAMPYLGLRLKIDTSISGLCFRSGAVLRSDDTEKDDRADREACRRMGARSLVVVPLTQQERTVGVLKVYSSRVAAFDDADVQSLQLIAGLLSSALADAQRFAREQQLTAELRESRERYRSIFEGAQEGFFLVERDEDGAFRYTDMNARLTAITGIRAADFVGSRPADVLPPEAAERVEALYARAFQTGELVEVAHTNALPRGEVTTRTRFHPILGAGGEVDRVLGITEDITEKKHAEEEREALLKGLQIERARLAEAFERAPSFFAVVRGPEHVFERANPAYCRLVGRRDLVGQRVIDALPEIVEQGFVRLLDRVLETGSPFAAEEMPIQLQRVDGSPLEERVVSFVYQAITEADGTRSGIFAHGIDVTEQVHARRAVEKSAALAQLNLSRLEAALAALPVGVFITDEAGVVQMTNPAAAEIWGGTPLS